MIQFINNKWSNLARHGRSLLSGNDSSTEKYPHYLTSIFMPRSPNHFNGFRCYKTLRGQFLLEEFDTTTPCTIWSWAPRLGQEMDPSYDPQRDPREWYGIMGFQIFFGGIQVFYAKVNKLLLHFGNWNVPITWPSVWALWAVWYHGCFRYQGRDTKLNNFLKKFVG